MPADALIFIERVEDVYYEKHNWGVFLKENHNTLFLKQQNADKELIEESLSQYTPAFCAFEDENKLFINLHY